MGSLKMSAAAVALVALALPGCDVLRDSEPFTVTVSYEQRADGTPYANPQVILADNSFGQVQVDNQTDVERGFAIDELAVFEVIRSRQVKTIDVDEAKDGRTYEFYDHKNPGTLRGQMRVRYRAEEFR